MYKDTHTHSNIDGANQVALVEHFQQVQQYLHYKDKPSLKEQLNIYVDIYGISVCRGRGVGGLAFERGLLKYIHKSRASAEL